MFLGGFIIVIGVITWNDITKCPCERLPWPPRIVMTGLTFGLLDLFSIVNEELAGVVAIGIVLAALVNHGFVTDCEHAGTAQPQTATFNALETASDEAAQPATGVPA